MIKLVDSCGNGLTQLKASRKIKYFQSGQFGEFNKYGNVIVSGGRNPIGIMDDIYTENDNTIFDNNIHLWTLPGFFETDQFEFGKYRMKSSLFVSANGKTNKST